jgi:hypothetical protein
MKKYHQSNKISFVGLALLFLAATVGAVAIGAVAFGVSRAVYLVLLFPLLMGLAGGSLNLWAIGWGKVRNLWVATISGLLTGMMIYGVFLYGGYLLYRSEKIGWTEGASVTEKAEVEADLDRSIVETNGIPGFLGYLNSKSKDGLVIVGKNQLGHSPIVVKGQGAWINWAIELLTICGITTWMSRWRVSAPFNEDANRWFDRASRLGTIPKSDIDRARAILDEGRLADFVKLVQLKGPLVPGGWEVHFKRCGEDFGEVALTLGKAMVIRHKLKLRQQQAWILNRSDLDEIAAAMRKHYGANSSL